MISQMSSRVQRLHMVREAVHYFEKTRPPQSSESRHPFFTSVHDSSLNVPFPFSAVCGHAHFRQSPALRAVSIFVWRQTLVDSTHISNPSFERGITVLHRSGCPTRPSPARARGFRLCLRLLFPIYVFGGLAAEQSLLLPPLKLSSRHSSPPRSVDGLRLAG